MNKIKLLILPIIAVLTMSFAAPVGVSAQSSADVCRGVNFTSGTNNSSCDAPAGSRTVEHLIKTVIDVLSIIVGVAAVIMIIIGGLKYITSSGDSNNVSSAKNTILYAIIGLVVVLLAQIIVRYVIDTATT